MCRNGHPLFIPEKYRLRMRSLVLGSWASEDVVDRYLNSVLCRPIPFLASSSHPFAAFFCVSFCSSFCSFLFISFSVAVKGFAFLSLGSLDIGIYPGQQLEFMPNERRVIVSFPRQSLSSLRSSRSTTHPPRPS